MHNDCAPEGGQFREPQPAPIQSRGERVLTLIVGLPIALVLGGLLAVAFTTPGSPRRPRRMR